MRSAKLLSSWLPLSFLKRAILSELSLDLWYLCLLICRDLTWVLPERTSSSERKKGGGSGFFSVTSPRSILGNGQTVTSLNFLSSRGLLVRMWLDRWLKWQQWKRPLRLKESEKDADHQIMTSRTSPERDILDGVPEISGFTAVPAGGWLHRALLFHASEDLTQEQQSTTHLRENSRNEGGGGIAPLRTAPSPIIWYHWGPRDLRTFDRGIFPPLDPGVALPSRRAAPVGLPQHPGGINQPSLSKVSLGIRSSSLCSGWPISWARY